MPAEPTPIPHKHNDIQEPLQTFGGGSLSPPPTRVSEDDKFTRVHFLRLEFLPEEQDHVDRDSEVSEEDYDAWNVEEPGADKEEKAMSDARPRRGATRRNKPVIIDAPSEFPRTLTHSPGTTPKSARSHTSNGPAGTSLASRPLTSREAWFIYDYEDHARNCHSCNSDAICDVGYALSRDVRIHVCMHDGEICSTMPDETGSWVRVEVPHGYDRARDLLSIDRQRLRGPRRPARVISYDEPRPSSRERESRGDTYVEPARTRRDDTKRPRFRPEQYEVVQVTPASGRDHDLTDGKGEPVRQPEGGKRVSLYERNIRRPRREYRIVERMPGQYSATRDQLRIEEPERRRREKEWAERDVYVEPARTHGDDEGGSRHATELDEVPPGTAQETALGIPA